MLDSMKSLIFLNRGTCYICRDNKADRKTYFCEDCYNLLDIKNERLYRKLEFLDDIYYASVYNRFLSRIIKDYKFNNKNYLYKPLGQLLLESIDKVGIGSVDLIIPVPIHWRKKARRGYNQSELLARYIAEKLEVELSSKNLIKLKATKPQSSLSRLERIRNLDKSFSLKDDKLIENRKILLVDDIITTGSTLNECGKILKQAGAKKVIGLALTANEI